MKTKRKSGQILILVLLVVVVSLAIGLSVASRNLTNLKISTQTEQSQRAYTVAENGVEYVLSKLGSVQSDPVNNPVAKAIASNAPVAGTPTDSAGTPSTVTVAANTSFVRPIPLNEVGQIDLTGVTVANAKFNVMWAQANSVSESTDPASLEVSLVYTDVGSNYWQKKWYFVGGSGLHTGSEPVTSSTVATSGGTVLGVETATFTYTYVPCAAGSVYLKCVTIDASVSGAGTNIVPGISSLKFLRVRPLWSSTTVSVSSNAAVPLPTQSYDITSTSTVGNGVSRKLLVQKNVLPSLPAVFNFALFSETGINKQ